MSLALARTLVLTDVVAWGSVAQALFVSATKDVPFIKALLETAALPLEKLEEELARADVPVAETVVPNQDLLDKLPRGMCARLLVVPLRRNPNGTIDVAFADARDDHATRELAHHLGGKIRILRAPYNKVAEAVSRLPTPRREEPVVESTLVSIRAPEGIQLPSSENSTPVSARGGAHRTETPTGTPTTLAPASASGSSPPLPLVRRASEQTPIPLVRRAEGEPVIELRSPFSRAAGRAYIESASVAGMRSANERDQILRLLLEGSMEVAKRVVLFAVRRDCFSGLMATSGLIDDARLKEVRIPLPGPSIFATVASGGTYLGPIYAVDAHKPVFHILQNPSDTVGVAAVRLRGRPLVLVLAEGMANPVQDVRHVEELARAAGEAFQRILATKPE